MAARTAGRKGRPFRKAQAQCYAEETHCYLCNQWVDQGLLNYRGRRARSVHHLIPPDIAPDLANERSNLRLAHLGCNASYGRGAYKGGAPSGVSTTRGRTPWGRRKRATHGRAMSLGGVGVGGAVTNPDRDW